MVKNTKESSDLEENNFSTLAKLLVGMWFDLLAWTLDQTNKQTINKYTFQSCWFKVFILNRQSLFYVILSLDKDFEAISKLGLASEGGHYWDALEEQKTREIETLSWESFDSVATTLPSLKWWW